MLAVAESLVAAAVEAVSERLGHGDVTTTLNYYAHVIPELQAQAVSRFAPAVGDEGRPVDLLGDTLGAAGSIPGNRPPLRDVLPGQTSGAGGA